MSDGAIAGAGTSSIDQSGSGPPWPPTRCGLAHKITGAGRPSHFSQRNLPSSREKIVSPYRSIKQLYRRDDGPASTRHAVQFEMTVDPSGKFMVRSKGWRTYSP